MRQQSTPCPQGSQQLGQAIARAAATPSGQQGMPTRDPPLLKLLPATPLPKPERSAGTPGSRRAVLSTTPYRSEPTANGSRRGAPGAAQALQSGPGLQDPLCFPSPPLPLGVRRALHPAPRALDPGLYTPPFPPAPPGAPPPWSRPTQARSRPLPPPPASLTEPGGGGATLGRGVAAGLHPRTRFRTVRLRVWTRDAHPESPP